MGEATEASADRHRPDGQAALRYLLCSNFVTERRGANRYDPAVDLIRRAAHRHDCRRVLRDPGVGGVVVLGLFALYLVLLRRRIRWSTPLAPTGEKE